MNTYLLPEADAHYVSLPEAIGMIRHYRQNKELLLQPGYQKQNLFCNSETFNLQAVQRLLAQKGVAALRIYYGMKEDFSVHAVLVATDSKGNDILPAADTQTAISGENGIILEDAQRCPPLCDDSSLLNS